MKQDAETAEIELTIWPLLSRAMRVWIGLIAVLAFAVILGVMGLNWNERINLGTTFIAVALALAALHGHHVVAALGRRNGTWQLEIRSGTLALRPFVTLPAHEIAALTVTERRRKASRSPVQRVLMIERKGGSQIFVSVVRSTAAEAQWLALSERVKGL